MSDPSREFDYRESWRWILGAAAFGAVAFGAGFYQLLSGYPQAPPLAGPVSGAALLCIGVFFCVLVARMTWDRLRQGRKIVITQEAITLPRSRWALSHVRIPLDDVTHARTTSLLGLRFLEIVCSAGRFVVQSSMLGSKDAFEDLLQTVHEQIEQRDATIEVGSTSLERRRPQFSLASLFVLVTFVALLLGLHGQVYGGYSWDTLSQVLVASAVLVGGLLLALWAGAAARAFLLAFIFGYFLEVMAVYCYLQFGWVHYGARSVIAQNWYPLTFAFAQMAEWHPALAWLRNPFCGTGTSGLLAGILTVVGYSLFKRARRSRWGRQSSPTAS